MKRLCMCAVALVMGGFLVFQVGCDRSRKEFKAATAEAIDAADARATVEMMEFREELRKKSLPDRAKLQLRDAMETHEKIAKDATTYRVEANVIERRIGRLEGKKKHNEDAFKALSEIARQAGLPKRNDASEEDRMKRIQVGSRTLSGQEIYQHLETYKREVLDYETQIADQNNDRDWLLNAANEVGKQSQEAANRVRDLERKIREFERIQNRIEIAERIGALSNTDVNQGRDILRELEDAIDRAEAEFDTRVQPRGSQGNTEMTPEELMRVLTEPKRSITEDDLV